MYILVNETVVTAYGEELPEGEGIPFEVDDFPGVSEGNILHWDGTNWWEEPDVASPVEVFTAIFETSSEMIETLSNDILSRMAPYMQPWEIDVDYAVGNIREFGGKPYRCLQAHHSQESWNPADAPSLWTRILPGQDGEIGVWEQPDSTNPYMKGDRVHYPTVADPVYESDIDNNVWPPDQYGWHQLLEGE